MKLYESWIQQAYDQKGQAIEKLWNIYIPKEQKIYEEILGEKINRISGTVKELSERFDMPVEYICGFIDGINDVLEQKIDVEEIDENTNVELKFEFEDLYKKMVEYKASHLQELPQWDNVFTPTKRKELYTQQKISTTFVRSEEKIGRNDPCPCGSGKKHKKCCGMAE